MKKHIFLYLLILLLLPQLSFAWQGKVVGVSDGDTITVMHAGKGEKIRLYGVDCPEKHQDFGQKAKQFTSNMVYGKTVDVEPVTTDRYGRTVGLVSVNGKSINEELLKAGLAWVFTRYCDKPCCKQWYKYQEEARQRKVNLWSMPNPVPPWEFRRENRTR
jgi:endonuclease YncB( thermonuclease family)